MKRTIVIHTLNLCKVQSMDDNCGEWVECMGVASGCGEQEVGVVSGSGWNLWMWLLGVVVRRYIDFLILLIPTSLVSVLFYSSIPTFCYFLALGAHAHREGYCSCPVCVYVCMCVCPLIPAASYIEITKERYQRIHCNTGIVFNFADFSKNASVKSYGVICSP